VIQERLSAAFFALLFGVPFGVLLWFLSIFITADGSAPISILIFTSSAFAVFGFITGNRVSEFIAAWFSSLVTVLFAAGGSGESDEELKRRHQPIIFTVLVIVIVGVDVWLALR